VNINAYVDTDFGGLWGFEDREHPDCVKIKLVMSLFWQIVPVPGVAVYNL
jgi:hypothetical protein